MENAALPDADRAELATLIRERLAEAEAASATAIGNDATVVLDQQSVGRLSRIDAMQQQAMARATAGRRAALVQRLRAALRRLDDPDFGLCAECGEAIGMARLRIDPTLARCADCTRGAGR